MTDSEKELWAQARAKGRDAFILAEIRRTGLQEGMVVLAVSLLFNVVAWGDVQPVWKILIESAVLGLSLGYLTAISRWRECEQDHLAPTAAAAMESET